MAAFLSYNEWQCGHEQGILLRSIHDLKNLFTIPYSGTVETASAQAWRLIQHHAPHVRHAVVRRPIDDVMKSMLAVDLDGYASYDVPRLRKVMEYGDRMLAEISRQPGVLTLRFTDLDTRAGCKALFEHCLPHHFDSGWWEHMRDRNVQVNVSSVIRYYHENKTEIEAFKAELWSDMRRLRRSNHITRH